MTRLTDNDFNFGPLTIARSGVWRPWRAVFSTGSDEGDHEENCNHLTLYAFGWILRIRMPRLMQPHRVKHIAHTWDEETVRRMGRNWYYETFPRDYGFSLHDGFLQLFHGAQTLDSTTDKTWCCLLPWTQWRHIRYSVFDDKGKHWFTEWSRPRGFALRDNWTVPHDAREKCPTVDFEFDDYDGKRIIAKTRIEERYYKFGEGLFKWLSVFRKDRLYRSLSIDFSEEVGPNKGSWKGGTMSHGIEMRPKEDHEAAFRRYCQQEQKSKHGVFRIAFVGKIEK